MKKRDFRRILAGAMAGVMMLGLTACGSSNESAAFPSDTVNIICHAKEGGGSDALAREVAQVMQDKLGWSVTVENKTGGSGSVGMQYVQNSKPDGYTIGTAPVELSMIQALGYAELNPDSVSLLGCGMSWSAALYVPKDAPYDNMEDFINYCKENPDVVKVANSGIGSIWHIAACAMADKAGISLNHVPYDGATGALTALLGSEVDAAVVGTCEGYSYVDSGDLKCLGVFGEDRSATMPDVPTAKEQGYDLNVVCWVGFLAPKDVDEATLTTLQDSLKTVFETDEYKSFCETRGCDSTYYSAEEFKKMADSDFTYYSELISSLGIVAQ